MTCLERITELLRERNWSMYTLAKRSGIPQSTLSNLFLRCNDPSVATLEKLCHAFGITMAEFFQESKSESSEETMLREYRRLSPEMKKHILAILKEL